MIITTLLENTAISNKYTKKHGLCLHIKTENNKILFDLGPDDTFIKNAIKLNIDIKDVDIVIISHGHKDHGGGLNAFLKYNKKAKIYIHKEAFNGYYTSILHIFKYYIGLDKNLKENNRIILTNDIFEINNDLRLFSNIKNSNLECKSNKSLYKKENNEYIQDKFKHEQNLILYEDNKYVLISGCAHNGITNIIEKAEDIINNELNTVISGFHLYNPVTKVTDSNELIEDIGEKLLEKRCTFYTCHCTGKKAFNILNKKLGDKINYIATGQVIEI